MNQISYTKTVPVNAQWDIIVCGGGPAGIAAAVCAARAGRRVLLLERCGILGGCLTMGNVSTLMGSVAEGGVSHEIDQMLNGTNPSVGIDQEKAKRLLETLVVQAGAAFRLHSPVVDVLAENSEINGVIVQTPAGPICFQAAVYIDATGDGYAAAMAGEAAMVGRDGDGLTQPCSLMYTIEGVDPDCRLTCCHEEHYTTLPNGVEYLHLCQEAEAAGRLPENVTIVRLYATDRPGERLVNATQANGLNPLTPGDPEKAELLLREQIEMVNRFLRAEVPGFEHIRLRQSANALGVRECRRIRGVYELRAEDLITGRRFPDVVVHRANFSIDIHNPSGGGQAETDGCPHRAQPYDIPLRALLPLKNRNLVLAGRCISGSHRAHASYRVMNIAMATGQAAAAVACAAIADGVPAHEVDPAKVQALLLEQGCTLFD